MKNFLERLLIIGAFLLIFPYSASALVTVDFGAPFTFSLKNDKENDSVAVSGGSSTTIDVEKKLKEAGGFTIRGKFDLALLSVGLGLTTLSDRYDIKSTSGSNPPTNTFKYDSYLVEFLLGLSLPVVDVGGILGAGNRTFKMNEFKSSSSDFGESSEVTHEFSVVTYGLYASLNSIDITGPLDLRIGASYQIISGSKETIDISDTYVGTTYANSKIEYEADPSTSLWLITIGIGF